jgi:anti-sigma regulatory factor (Ser/Thr protein kinase)
MCWSAAHDYRPTLAVPAAGRRFCREHLDQVLTDTPPREDVISDAELIVSELLTNAVRAGCRTARLGLAVHRDLVRISVADDAPGTPHHRRPGDVVDRTPGGWGLWLLDEIAEAWAVETLIPGKEVWAELAVPLELTLDMPSCHRPVQFDTSGIAPIDATELPEIGTQLSSEEPATTTGADSGELS